MKLPLYMIKWVDAQSDCEWGSVNKIKEWAKKDCIICEVGWIIDENERYLVISNQVGEDMEFGNRTKIPKQWVIKRKKIKI